MTKPSLVVMAAGMGSRFGGCKQVKPIDSAGHTILDFSVYDAMRAGFGAVYFIIKEEMRASFQETVGNRIAEHIPVCYVFQKNEDLPSGFSCPPERSKPWGTAHALFACRNQVKGHFAVINADDYYGSEAFQAIFRFFTESPDDTQYGMAGYRLENTLSDYGAVSRGICRVNQNGSLLSVVEHLNIRREGQQIFSSCPDGRRISLLPDHTVSMNFWGLSDSIFPFLEQGLARFLSEQDSMGLCRNEYYLPSLISELIEQRLASVRVIPTGESWFGMTYPEDYPLVCQTISSFQESGRYPKYLWAHLEERRNTL